MQLTSVYAERENGFWVGKPGHLKRRQRLGLQLFAEISISAAWLVFGLSVSVNAEAWDLVSSPGRCFYIYDRILDETTTECSAVATILNTETSEIIRCSGLIKGNQGMAPSVEENVPDAVFCRSIGRVMAKGGPFAINSLDDDFVEERTKVRRRGQYVWANAFWVYSLSGKLDIKLCAARKVVQNPDFGQRCSKTVVWPDRD